MQECRSSMQEPRACMKEREIWMQERRVCMQEWESFMQERRFCIQEWKSFMQERKSFMQERRFCMQERKSFMQERRSKMPKAGFSATFRPLSEKPSKSPCFQTQQLHASPRPTGAIPLSPTCAVFLRPPRAMTPVLKLEGRQLAQLLLRPRQVAHDEVSPDLLKRIALVDAVNDTSYSTICF